MVEAHGSTYSIHPGATKMYHDLKEVYWWEAMKRDISKFMEECTNCQHVMAEHNKPGGITPTIDIPTWKCPVRWSEVGQSAILVLEIVQEDMEKVIMIRDRLATAYSRQKSHADNRKRAFEFERVGNFSYELKLPKNLASIQPVFLVSMLKKFLGYPASMLPVERLGVDENLYYEEVPMENLYRQVK
ncbi:uncharacterized protein [Solanum lycopersicum]|uniref:uncharacterized protein n=1 Tax=Solanum lycopersicum TaxID=4081 RepID=UPI0002BC9499